MYIYTKFTYAVCQGMRNSGFSRFINWNTRIMFRISTKFYRISEIYIILPTTLCQLFAKYIRDLGVILSLLRQYSSLFSKVRVLWWECWEYCTQNVARKQISAQITSLFPSYMFCSCIIFTIPAWIFFPSCITR